MPDDHDRAAAGAVRTRIDVDQAQALHEWARKFDATPEQIRDAVQAVGDLAADVEMYLKGTHATTNADQQARADKGGR